MSCIMTAIDFHEFSQIFIHWVKLLAAIQHLDSFCIGQKACGHPSIASSVALSVMDSIFFSILCSTALYKEF